MAEPSQAGHHDQPARDPASRPGRAGHRSASHLLFEAVGAFAVGLDEANLALALGDWRWAKYCAQCGEYLQAHPDLAPATALHIDVFARSIFDAYNHHWSPAMLFSVVLAAEPEMQVDDACD